MKFISKIKLALIAMLLPFLGAKAVGWPAAYEGVMLQGFYWDSYSETSWSKLTAQADELSKYFKLIWVPNSAKAEGSPTMGYHPVYWFTNHNSSFGTEAQLRTMISTFKEKGTGIIADVVINHRSGVSNWTNFPSETWNGTTYKLTAADICRDDEVNGQSGQETPTGNYDTGESWSGSRDLDHTSTNVQNNCKAYVKCLLTDYGYAGVRYDFVKGYAPQYTKMYNQANNVTYSVGECWDGNYDTVKTWIEGTGKESAAFDFPFKYAVNEAFSSGDLSKLVWLANGSNPQPAGLIHYGYPQLAVTFIDNHDTYRDGSKFTGNVLQANAFMLSCPGTPCVFWPHYTANKSAIQAMIEARNGVGISNTSTVTVLEHTSGAYVAEVVGSKGKLWVKIGSSSQSPSGSGYTKKASGSGYEIWTTAEGGGGGGSTTPNDPTEDVTIYFDNSSTGWTTPYIHYWGASESTWPGVAMTKVSGDIWKYVCPAGTTGILFNAGDGDATKTADFTAINNHLYNTSGDQGVYSGTGGTGGGGGTTTDGVNIYFDNTSSAWTTPHIHYWGGSESAWPGVAMTKYKDNVWKYTCPTGTTGILFNAGDGDATKTPDFVAVNNHLYTTSGDQGTYSDAETGGGGTGTGGTTVGDAPAVLYLIGDLPDHHWEANYAVEMTKNGDKFVANDVELEASLSGYAYFSFATVLGTTANDWDGDVEGSTGGLNSGDRYGAVASDTQISNGESLEMRLYAVGVDASACSAWQIAPGTYTFTADFSTGKVTIGDTNAVQTIADGDDLATPIYFNLQGIRVDNPTRGSFYIVRRGTKVTKEIIR